MIDDMIEGHIDINAVPPKVRGALLSASVAWNIVAITDKALQHTGKAVKNPHHELMLGMALAASDLLLYLQKRHPDIVDKYCEAVRNAVDKKLTAAAAMADCGINMEELVKITHPAEPKSRRDPVDL